MDQRITILPKVWIQPEVKRPGLLVIIPALNEEKCIGYVVEGIHSIAPQADILVINDGSIDRTARVAKHFGANVLTLPHNLGIGGAIRAGLVLAEELGYSYVVRMDGDGQHNAEDLLRLVSPVQNDEVDVVFGARFCGQKDSYCPSPIRRFGIIFYGFVVSLLIKQKIHDATSGYWCLNRKAIRYFAHHFPQDYPEVESHVLLYKAGLRQMEVPVHMRARINGHSSISAVRSVYYVFKVLLAVLIRYIQEAPAILEEEDIP